MKLDKLTFNQTYNEETDEYKTTFNNLFYRNGFNLIIGKRASGKTTVAVRTVLCEDKFEHKFFINLDNKSNIELNKISKYCRKYNVKQVSSRDIIAYSNEDSEHGKLTDSIDSYRMFILDLCLSINNSLILIDSFKYLQKKSNEADDIKNFLHNLIFELSNHNNCIIIVGHTGKDERKGLRGTSEVEEYAAAIQHIQKQSNGKARITCTKDAFGMLYEYIDVFMIKDKNTIFGNKLEYQQVVDINSNTGDIKQDMDSKELLFDYVITYIIDQIKDVIEDTQLTTTHIRKIINDESSGLKNIDINFEDAVAHVAQKLGIHANFSKRFIKNNIISTIGRNYDLSNFSGKVKIIGNRIRTNTDETEVIKEPQEITVNTNSKFKNMLQDMLQNTTPISDEELESYNNTDIEE